MKRQRGEDFAMGKKKGKREVEEKVESVKEEKRESGDFGSGEKDMGWTWTSWEECYDWPWLGSGVDEQMSWSSIWLPGWDLDIMGEAFNALYSDVVWDDDIWNLRNQIPHPSER